MVRRYLLPLEALLHAELLAAKGDWAKSDEEFILSIQLSHGVEYGLLWEALAGSQFGRALLAQKRFSGANEQFKDASDIYKGLGNLTRSENLLKAIQVTSKLDSS